MSEESESWLARHGIPPALFGYCEVFDGRMPRPIVWLGDEVERGLPKPDPGLLEVAARAGAAMYVLPHGVFDLRDMAGFSPHLQVFRCYGEPEAYVGMQALSDFVSLRELIAPRCEEVVDVSRLTSLESAFIVGDGLRRVGALPHLRSFSAEFDTLEPDFEFGPSLESIGLDCRKGGSLAGLGAGHRLRELVLKRFPQVDLTPLAAVGSLELLLLIRCRSIQGVRSLRQVNGLREVEFSFASKVDDPEALLELTLDRFSAHGNKVFTRTFISRSSARPGIWFFDRPVEDDGVDSAPFEVLPAVDATTEITFRDWDRLQQALGGVGRDGAIETTEELEGFVDWVLRTAAPDIPQLSWTFDSEGDRLIVQIAEPATATQTLYWLNRLFLDSAELDRLLAAYGAAGG